jgi:hypothetical protein
MDRLKGEETTFAKRRVTEVNVSIARVDHDWRRVMGEKK